MCVNCRKKEGLFDPSRVKAKGKAKSNTTEAGVECAAGSFVTILQSKECRLPMLSLLLDCLGMADFGALMSCCKDGRRSFGAEDMSEIACCFLSQRYPFCFSLVGPSEEDIYFVMPRQEMPCTWRDYLRAGVDKSTWLARVNDNCQLLTSALSRLMNRETAAEVLAKTLDGDAAAANDDDADVDNLELASNDVTIFFQLPPIATADADSRLLLPVYEETEAKRFGPAVQARATHMLQSGVVAEHICLASTEALCVFTLVESGEEGVEEDDEVDEDEDEEEEKEESWREGQKSKSHGHAYVNGRRRLFEQQRSSGGGRRAKKKRGSVLTVRDVREAFAWIQTTTSAAAAITRPTACFHAPAPRLEMPFEVYYFY